MHISLIWAMTRNRVIGRDNTLPWRMPKDMRHFMDTTMGKPVVMGRKSFESMKAALPGRTNIVLTRDRNWARTGAQVVHSLDAAIELGREAATRSGGDEIMIIGGADIYALALPLATRLYVTLIDAEVPGDTFFPDYDESAWQVVREVAHPADERHFAPYRITTFERVGV
ncbi:MAG: dihydrofolate reductase [Pseudomonadota bacterium]